MISRFVTCTFVWFSLILVTQVNAASRVALVIGNSAYTEVTALRNPLNDANALAQSLEDLDFKVVLGIDLDHRSFTKIIRKFEKVSTGADVALFFYAGHGLQVDGSNFLLPVDAAIESETDLAFEAIDLNIVLKMMEREKRINLVFLDACRDNPMSRSLSRSMGTRSSSIGRGLAQVKSRSGTLIGFATEPGNVALDGEGTVNSPFTTALLKHIKTPNLDVARLMRRVRVDVIEATNGRQVPWTSESLTSDFAFNTGRSIAVVPVKPDLPIKAAVIEPVVISSKTNNTQTELALWDAVKNSNSVELLEEYLKQYPKGNFAVVARFHIKNLSRVKTAAISDVPLPTISKKTTLESRNASIIACDLAAAVPFNPDNPNDVPGVSWRDLRASNAIRVCETARAGNPQNLRIAFQLARSYQRGGQYRSAATLYKQGAAAEYTLAQTSLAEIYFFGKGVMKDRKQAANWYRKAAERGDAYSQDRLAFMYEKGWDITRNPKLAAEWYYKALAGKLKRVSKMDWDIPTLKELQQLLQNTGYYGGVINGKMTTGTKHAMEALCNCG